MGSYRETERDYRYILEKVGPEKFRERLDEMLDYYADIFRLKEFHDIQYVRTEKIFAYTAAWIVKRKPLQFIHDTDEEKDIFVNERFAVFLLLNECLLCGEKRFVAKENKQKLDEYIDLLLYYLKYRVQSSGTGTCHRIF